MNISALTQGFLVRDRTAAVLLDDEQVEAQLIAATRFYAGYCDLLIDIENKRETTLKSINGETIISVAEWANIRPVFLLYIERETALLNEATGMQGVSGYGRTSSEVDSEITRLEETFYMIAAYREAKTIGGEWAIENYFNDHHGDRFPYGFDYWGYY